jgi:excisionase family DNA binding protein
MSAEFPTSKDRRRIPWRERETVTVEEAAMILGISRNHAYSAVKSGAMGGFWMGQRFLVSVPWLKRQIDGDQAA